MRIHCHSWSTREYLVSVEICESNKIFTTLFGPMASAYAKSLKLQLSQPMVKSICESVDIDRFIDFSTKVRFNGIMTTSGFAIFSTSSRFSHSCLPNCYWEPFNVSTLVTRTIRPIKKGEELTICYNEEFTLNPTYQRRVKYLTSKEFLCNCERCSAIGDTTRRFSCTSSSTCSGYFCVCQPTAEDKPYLLLCSKCGVKPTPVWKQSC